MAKERAAIQAVEDVRRRPFFFNVNWTILLYLKANMYFRQFLKYPAEYYVLLCTIR
jgi:hypothetical protein